MKIYNREEFLKLPEGIIFSQGKKWYFDGLFIKGEIGNWCPDFLQLDLIDIDSSGCGDRIDRLYEMLEQGKSYPLHKHYGRDGAFEDDAIFLVYEKEDLKKLKIIIDEALQISE